MEEHMISEYEGDPRFMDSNEEYWFWDEIWIEKHGPFKTLEECTEKLNLYGKELDRI